MMHRLMLKSFFLTALACGMTFSAWAEVDIEAILNPTRIQVGQQMTLTITVKNASGQVYTPRLPNFVDMRSYAQGSHEQMRWVNGVMSTRNVFTYVLVPQTPGKHVLGQIDVRIDNRVYKTGVLEAEVLPKSGTAATQAPQYNQMSSPRVVPPSPALPPSHLAGEHLFVRAWADKDEVVVGEPVYLTYTMYSRVPWVLNGFERKPVATGFWVEEFPPKRVVSGRDKNIGGQIYNVADAYTMAFFPNETGRLTIEPGILKVNLEFRNPNSRRTATTDIFGFRRMRTPSEMTRVESRLFETDPVHIKVKPHPTEGKPTDFNGAVGRYEIEAGVDHTQVEEGQPITYQLKLTGEGNLNTVDLPRLPPLDYFKAYDSSTSLNLDKERLIVEGVKVAETVLVAKKAGSFEIPSLSFSFYDARREQYRTLHTKAIPITVKASSTQTPAPLTIGPTQRKQEVELLGEDIRHIKASAGRFRKMGVPWIYTHRYWQILGGIILMALFVFIVKIAMDRPQNALGSRFRKSHGVAHKRLKKAAGLLDIAKRLEFHEALSEALYGYFTDKMGLQPGQMGHQLVQNQIKDRISATGFERLKELLTRLDYGRFANADVSLKDMQTLYADCSELITLFERKQL